MTDSAKRNLKNEVIGPLEGILAELDNLQLSLAALKIAEALEILSDKMDDSCSS
ncbi:hypothetical protein [Parasphingorhabdus sp.]|uniref:hypothetical protein n=1 Tax=Parasphingorhabdus sp. TaxID=2709688 RepID=UPI003001C7B3